MINELTYWFLLAQESAASSGASSGADTENTEPTGLFGGGIQGLMIPIAMVVVLYIFMMVLPNRRDQQKAKDLMEGLKKNDRVVTAGGIIATVANVQKDSEFITLKLDDTSNAKMKIMRSSISRVLEAEASGDGSEAKK